MRADFSKIIRDSIAITKRNKRLWVFGLVLASLGAGANFGSSGNMGDVVKDAQKQKTNTVIEQQTPHDAINPLLLNNTLGTTATSLTQLIQTIPVSFYISLVFLIIIGIIVFTAVSLYGQSWAQSGLIYGVDRENVGETLTLGQMSDKGKLMAKEVIKIRLIPGLIFAIFIVISTLIVIIPLLVMGDAGKLLTGVAGIVLVIAVVLTSIILSASINLGILAINLESLKWQASLSRGFTVFKRFFLDVCVMSCINCFSGCVFGVASLLGLLVLGGIGVASVFGALAFPPFVVVAGPVVMLALLALLMLMGLIGTISAVFNQTTWVLLYRQLTEVNRG